MVDHKGKLESSAERNQSVEGQELFEAEDIQKI
jgi:hypothetical protein